MPEYEKQSLGTDASAPQSRGFEPNCRNENNGGSLQALDLLADNGKLPDESWLSAGKRGGGKGGVAFDGLDSLLEANANAKLKEACQFQEKQMEVRKTCFGKVTIPVHFVTNRPLHFDQYGEVDGFKAGQGDELYSGVLNVTLPALDRSPEQRQAANKEMGWIYDNSTCIDKAQVAPPNKLWSHPNLVYDDIEKRSPQGKLAYFVPGFNTNFRTAAVMAAMTERDWGVPVVLDSWPCQDRFGVSSYHKDERSIEAHYQEVTRPLVEEGIKRRGANNIYAIGFSMGTRAVTEIAVDQKKLYDKSQDEKDLLGYVAEAEPDQDAQWFKKSVLGGNKSAPRERQMGMPTNQFTTMMSGITGGSREVAVYGSDPQRPHSDLALLASKEVHHGRMPLGLAGKELFQGLPYAMNNIHFIVVNEINHGPFFHEDHDLVMANFQRDHSPGPGMCLRDESGNLGAGYYLRLLVGKECAGRNLGLMRPVLAPEENYFYALSKGNNSYSLDWLKKQ